MATPPRRALLIGVSDYDDPSIDSLPFIADDLDDLDKALASVGYQVERHPPQHSDRDRIDTAIEQFCRRAETGQQLLIFLSGHGIHRDGRDYLLPSSADTTSRKFTEKCLEIEFTGHIEDSRCGDVLVVIDACREGVRLQEKSGYSSTRPWSRQQRERAAGRTVAYLYACSSGELARWKDTPEGTFSLFTRAFSRTLTDTSVAGTLTGVREAVRVHLENLSADLGVPLQRPHLDGDGSHLVLVDRPKSAGTPRGAAGWADRAKNHAVWDLVRVHSDGPELPESAGDLRDATVECVETWSEEYQRLCESLRDDPWWDDELAIRMHDRLSWMVKHLLNRGKLAEAEKPPLSPAEAAILVLLPFAQQVHRASAAVANRSVLDTPDPADDRHAEFARYVDGRSRIRRRLRRLDADGDHENARTIRWAAYHRWLAQRPQLYREQVIRDSLLAPLASPDGPGAHLLHEVMSATRLARLLRALRSDPEAASADGTTVDALDGTAIPAGAQTVAGGSPDEQTVRDRLLALILLVAEEFTIDATALPDVVTDHIGLMDGVEPEEVLRAVQGARWLARGRTRVLEADCPHQAVELALDEHTNGIAEVLRRIDAAAEADRTLEALRDLPTHVTADALRPLAGPDGEPRYDMVGFRFRLDDDQVQELLMGEQLYGDPALAIRELYQNALDACRYRRARTQHLRNQGRWTADWDGRIVFTQGVDERGRAFLECRDNGIGMSERELSSVFSHAGARFADLPEFLEEQAVWNKEDIEFYPNSRFGIGVLSYFMLGDEIEVSTARFSRDGTTAAQLRVYIDGPGSLCRIRTAVAGSESGTTVRVFLRQGISVSCTELLSKLLWVAEFPVEASDGPIILAWEPGTLSPHAPIGGDEPDLAYGRSMRIVDEVIPSTVPHVWWCDGPGAVLADGLWAGDKSFGHVVNLVGSMVPRLTVDRRRILWMDRDHVERLLHASLPDLFSETCKLLTLNWLRMVGDQYLTLADEIAEKMIDHGVELSALGGVTIRTALVGVFPLDAAFFLSGTGTGRVASVSRDSSNFPDLDVGRWRLRHYLQAGCIPGVRLTSEMPTVSPILPSDVFLLSATDSGKAPWIDFFQMVSAAHVLMAAVRVNRSPRRVAERLAELSLSVPDFAWPSSTLGSEDVQLLSRDFDGQGPWIDLTRPVSAGRVLRTAIRLQQSPQRVAGRLAELGLSVPTLAWSSTPLDGHDLQLLSRDFNGRTPWVDLTKPFPVGRVLRAAGELRWPPRRVVERLNELGMSTPDFAWPPMASGTDIALFSKDLDGRGPWTDLAEPAAVGFVFAAAATLEETPRRVAERMIELGLTVPDFDWQDVAVGEDDLVLFSADVDEAGSWLELVPQVPAGHVFAAAAARAETPRRVAERLIELGLSVPDFDWPEVALLEDDLQLLSADANNIEKHPWLDPSWPVTVGHVSTAAAALEMAPRSVAERLAEIGFALPDSDWSDSPLSDDDLILLSLDLDGIDPWLDPKQPTPIARVSMAAVRLEWSPRQVAERLTSLGLPVPDHDLSRIVAGADDIKLLSADLDGQEPWLAPAQMVPIGHVFAAAAATRWSPRQIADRMVQFGLSLPEFDWPDVALDSDDRAFFAMAINRIHLREDVWKTLLRSIDISVLMPGLSDAQWSIGHGALRLQQLGFTLPEDIEIIPDELPEARHSPS